MSDIDKVLLEEANRIAAHHYKRLGLIGIPCLIHGAHAGAHNYLFFRNGPGPNRDEYSIPVGTVLRSIIDRADRYPWGGEGR